MKDAQTILDEYERGDLTRRLFMFLDHRSLRQEFMEIDQREDRAEKLCPALDAVAETPSVFRRVLAFFRSPCHSGCCAPKGASQ